MTRDVAAEKLRKAAIELSAISESGLAYCTDQFDIERFHRIGAIARDILQPLSDNPLPGYDPEIASAAGYATPKLDVRGGVFDDEGQVLLVRESADDDRWTLPGGWCDVLEPPRAAIEREVREEAGVTVKASHLAAVIDREEWPHEPPFDAHVYKLFFICEALSPVDLTFTSNETSAVAWFPVNALPQLSVSRVLPEQIQLMHQHWLNPGPAYVD